MLGRAKGIVLALFLFAFSFQALYDLSDFKVSNLTRLLKSNQTPRMRQNSTTRMPLISLSNRWSSHRTWGNFSWVTAGHKSELDLSSCPHRCRFSIDRGRYQDTADMVILNTFFLKPGDVNFRRKSILKNQRIVGQIWVGVTLESPYYQRSRGKELDDVFHWISTYRKDADIFWPYATYTKRTVTMKVPPQKKKPKKKLAAWLVSRCSTQSKRELLVTTLQRYIPVDIYGKCGGALKCPRGQDCRAYLAANYKFYLAFENSLCTDYVTEKLFFMLNQSEPIVPVTYSWINDTTLAPPNSYIDARDFKHIKYLADYLQYLDKHDEEYNGYLQWKNDYKIVFDSVDNKLCKACGMLLKYKEQLAHGRERLKRQPSMLKRLSSFGNGANYSYFKVSGNLIKAENACFSPLENQASWDWLSGAELS